MGTARANGANDAAAHRTSKDREGAILLSVCGRSAEGDLKRKSRTFINFDRDTKLEEVLQNRSVFVLGGYAEFGKVQKKERGCGPAGEGS